MKAEIEIIALVQCLIFLTQVIVLFVQYRINRDYRGIRWWVWGSVLMALGVIFMPMVTIKSLLIFAMISNPLIVLGQILLYVGIMEFLDKKSNRSILCSIYAAFIAFYYYYMFFDNDISARTIAINLTLATITLTTSYRLFFQKDRPRSSSSNFTALVFLLYGCFLATRMFFALLLPPMHTYSDQATVLIVGFIIPIVASTLWTFGFIIMLNQRLDMENRKEKEQIKLLVGQLEVERNLAQLNSITDSLTGLANRRYFDETLKTEFLRLKRSGATLSLIMLDVDYFKKFNDTYGHLAGDDCLRQIGNILKMIVGRAPDIVARFGGEEFVLILPETGKNGAKSLAERIINEIKILAIPHSESDVSDHVTVSIGIASVSTAELESPDQVVTLVDEAMYRAKKSGRNRIEWI